MPRHTAPHVDAGIGQLLIRIELLPHDGVDAVAGNRDIATNRWEGLSRREFRKRNRYTFRILLDARTSMIREDDGRSQPFDCGLEQHHVQTAAMNPKVRIWIARMGSTLFAVNELAVSVEETVLADVDGGFPQLRLETQRREFAHRVGKQRDTNAEWPYFRSRFIDAAGKASLL